MKLPPRPTQAAPLHAQKEVVHFFAPFWKVQTHDRLIRARNRHGGARLMICVLFGSVVSFFWVFLFVCFCLFLSALYRHRLWPVHQADQVQGAHFGHPKKVQKWATAWLFLVSSLSTTDFCFLSFDDRKKVEKMAANTKVYRNSLNTLYIVFGFKITTLYAAFTKIAGENQI